MKSPWQLNVALFVSGQAISLFGSMVVQYAVMWWVTLETRSGLAMALYALAAFAPQGVVALFGGVLADRLDRRVLVMVADGGIALATLVLALLMSNGVNQLWVILLAVAVRSVGAGIQTPAVRAMFPQIVPGEQLLRVNAIFQTIQSAMALLAPATAGAIFAVFGIVPVYFLDVTTAVIGIALLGRVSVPRLKRMAEVRTTYRQDLAEGMRYLRAHRIVRWLLSVYAITFLLTIAPSYVTPLLVVRSFGTEEWLLTVLELAFSAGMLLGGALMSTVLTRRGRIGLIMVATYGFGVVTVAMGLSTNLWVFYGFMFAFGMLADLVSAQVLLIIAGLMTIAVMAIATRLPSGQATIAATRTPVSPPALEAEAVLLKGVK